MDLRHIEVEPLGFTGPSQFEIVGGVVPRQFIPSVEKGVRWQMEQGVTAGYLITDSVILDDGKAHRVTSSSDMAFQKACLLALRDAVDKAQPMLLEPVDEDVRAGARRAAGAANARPVLRAVAGCSAPSGRRRPDPGPGGIPGTRRSPGCRITLRSVSHGTGSFTRQYLRHEPLPSHLAAKVAADSKPG